MKVNTAEINAQFSRAKDWTQRTVSDLDRRVTAATGRTLKEWMPIVALAAVGGLMLNALTRASDKQKVSLLAAWTGAAGATAALALLLGLRLIYEVNVVEQRMQNRTAPSPGSVGAAATGAWRNFWNSQKQDGVLSAVWNVEESLQAGGTAAEIQARIDASQDLWLYPLCARMVKFGFDQAQKNGLTTRDVEALAE